MSKTFKWFFLLVLTGIVRPINSFAQEIPVGEWRTHVSFNSVHTISLGGSVVYAASDNGVLAFDPTESSTTTISRLSGLSASFVTHLAADAARHQLLVGFADGSLDILQGSVVINFDRLKTSTTISGSKRINHVMVEGNLAYLSTDYGVVVFDLVQLEVRETYRDLGASGETIKVYQSVMFNDSLFLATEKGVMAGDRDDNLLDFNKWKRFNGGAFVGDVQSIVSFSNSLYAAINTSGIYQYSSGTWELQDFLQNQTIKNLIAGPTHLLITEGTNLWKLTASETIIAVTDDAIVNPVVASEDGNGKLWVGDQRRGLVSNVSGSFESYVPNGPTFSTGLKLRYDMTGKRLFAVSGGYTSGIPLQRDEYLNIFQNGSWSSTDLVFSEDLTDAVVSGNRTIVSSFGRGIEVIENETVVFQDDATATLVSAMAASVAGVWIANYGAAQSLHLLKSDNTWESFSFALSASRYVTDLEVDGSGNVWMAINPINGGGIFVFDREGNRTAYLSQTTGSGGLPSNAVYSLALDRDGQVWVGTNEGVAYFPNPSAVFSGGVNAVKPVIENRFLLRDEKVTAIDVDGGNRKWMGTERGVWLFSPIGDVQVYNFNISNSPLLSDKIIDIEINHHSGEVFFMTDSGISSFRSDATRASYSFSRVKIFPNPVTAMFNGRVAISGLATDAVVKITDVAGRLVWQTYAQGGTATWNIRDYNGNRVSTGMYLVLSTTQDGSESVVGKIAVVD